MKMTYDPTQNENIPMTIKVIAECTECKATVTLYVSEDTKKFVSRVCPNCNNDVYKIVYRC